MKLPASLQTISESIILISITVLQLLQAGLLYVESLPLFDDSPTLSVKMKKEFRQNRNS